MMCLKRRSFRYFKTLTGQYDHVNAPDETPRPADQQERDGEELHRADHEIDAAYGRRSVLPRRHSALATAEYRHSRQHRTYAVQISSHRSSIQSINHLIHTRQSYKHKINNAVHVV